MGHKHKRRPKRTSAIEYVNAVARLLNAIAKLLGVIALLIALRS